MKIHTSANRHTRELRLTGTSEAERLDALATTVERLLADDAPHPPTLVAAVGAGTVVEVLFDPLHDHPAVELEGFTAPPSWWCLGVVADGRARTIDDTGTPPPAEPPRPFPIHLAHVVGRSGRTARVLRDRTTGEVVLHPAAPDPADPAPQHPADAGTVDDCVRRALGLPTPPPRHDSTELYASLWVHAVMHEAALHHLLGASWAEVAALHPVLEACLDTGDLELTEWATEHLAEAAPLLAVAHPWERIRASSRDGGGPLTGRAAELAGWLDEGSFARLVMGNLTPLEDLLADLHHLLAPAVHARVLDTVAAWGLLGGIDR